MSDTARADMSFIGLVLSGRAILQDIDSYVEQWHEAEDGSPAADMELHEFLGLSWDEYRLWVEKPESLRFTLMSRQRGIALKDLLESATQQKFMMAARTTNSKNAQDVYEWLETTGRLRGSRQED